MFIKHRRLENSPFTRLNSPANIWYPMTTFYSDMEPLSKYSPVNMHLSPATRIPSEALGIRTQPVFQITLISKLPQRKSVCGLTFLFSLFASLVNADFYY